MRTKFLLTLLLGVFLVSSVLAMGVSSPYFKDNPLKISPGQTIKPALTFQNMAPGATDTTVSVTIAAGNEIATLGKTTYNLPAATKDIPLEMTIKIPSDAQVGQTYRIEYSYATVDVAQSGQMSFGTATDSYFDILVVGREESYVPTPKTNYTPILLVALLIIIILAVIIYFLKKKKTNKRK